MSGRPTAEIVADIRRRGDRGQLANEAADRLAELDAEVNAVNAALDQYDAESDNKAADPLTLYKFLAAVAKAVGR